MNILDEKKHLFSHMFWADAEMWKSVLDLADYKNELKFKELLYHIHTVQHAYLSLWLGRDLNIVEPDSFEDFQGIADWGLRFYDELADYLTGLTAADASKLIPIPWAGQLVDKIGKPPEKTSLLQMMNQVILHSSYHRAQINTLIRESGGEPPLVDYIWWVWIGEPAAVWPTGSGKQ